MNHIFNPPSHLIAKCIMPTPGSRSVFAVNRIFHSVNQSTVNNNQAEIHVGAISNSNESLAACNPHAASAFAASSNWPLSVNPAGIERCIDGEPANLLIGDQTHLDHKSLIGTRHETLPGYTANNQGMATAESSQSGQRKRKEFRRNRKYEERHKGKRAERMGRFHAAIDVVKPSNGRRRKELDYIEIATEIINGPKVPEAQRVLMIREMDCLKAERIQLIAEITRLRDELLRLNVVSHTHASPNNVVPRNFDYPIEEIMEQFPMTQSDIDASPYFNGSSGEDPFASQHEMDFSTLEMISSTQ